MFQKFLQKEFCEENLEFYLDVSKFKQMQSETSLKKKYEQIKSTYIEMESPREVNIPGPIRESLLRPDTPIHNEIFDKAITSILQLLKFDSFRRFMQTDDYKKLRTSTNKK